MILINTPIPPLSLPAGASLSGNYPTSVSVRGDAQIVGDVTVNGDLLVNGRLTNPNGHALTVFGDLICLVFDFTPASTAVVQQDVNIYGDLKCSNKQVTVSGSTNTQVIASGSPHNWNDFNVVNDLQSLGVPSDDSPTLTITSGAHSGFSSTFTYNNNGDGTTEIFLDSTPTGGQIPYNTTMHITWTTTVTYTNIFWANPARQPTLWVRGNMETYAFDGSWNDNGAAGINLYVDGDLINNDEGGDINISGGPSSASVAGGNGGSLYTGGDCLVTRVVGTGGDTSNAGKAAGKGATVWVGGNCFSRVVIHGGASNGGAASGDGGTLDVFGDCTELTVSGEDDNINTSGGPISGGAPASAGNAGAIHIRGSMNGRIRANGGYCAGGGYSNAASSTINLGNGGTVTIEGNYNMENNGSGFAAQCSGGGLSGNPDAVNSITVNGGNGGSLTVMGNLITRSVGLGCSSGDNTFSTGAGTNLLFNGGNGGSITVLGQLLSQSNDTIGVGGGWATGSGGGSGGGDPASIGQGGHGGTINLLGGGNTGPLDASGGQSNAALPKGAAGNIFLANGTKVRVSVTLKDGATGTAITTPVTLTVDGHVILESVSVENRTDAHIQGGGPQGGNEAMLQVGTLTDKKTLWNGTSESADQSGNTATSLFKWSSATSLWYKIAGTSI